MRIPLQLSRYIHRNPIETIPPLVQKFETYLGLATRPILSARRVHPWLERAFVYTLVGQRQKYHTYRAYVEAGVDDAMKDFYTRDRTSRVLGGEALLTWVRERHMQKDGHLGFSSRDTSYYIHLSSTSTVVPR